MFTVNTEKVLFDRFVSKRLNDIRQAHGYSINKIAELTGLRHQRVKAIMDGTAIRVSIEDIAMIADVFSMTLRDVFNYGYSDPSTEEILRIVGRLPKEQKKALLKFLDTLC